MSTAVWHCPHGVVALAAGGLSMALACTSTVQPPRVLVLPSDFKEQSTPLVTGYPSALRAIAKVLATDLGLPLGPVALQLYPNRASLTAGLVAEGFSLTQSRRMAALMEAIGRPGKVLVNEMELSFAPWPVRFRVLAHEMAHIAEYEAAGRRRGCSEQWLREGFAEWAAARVMESFGIASVAQLRRRAVAGIGMQRDLGTLLELVTAEDWVRGSEGRNGPTSYEGAFIAVDLLVRRHGVEAVTRYFSLCATTDDPGAAFEAAFLSPRESLPAELESYLEDLRYQ